MNAHFQRPRTANIRLLFTQLELELQENNLDIIVVEAIERNIAAQVKLLINEAAAKQKARENVAG